MTLTATLGVRLAEYRRIATDFGVPVEVVEYLFELASDYKNPRNYRVARTTDERALRKFAHKVTAATDESCAERFYWAGEEYLVGFTFDR